MDSFIEFTVKKVHETFDERLEDVDVFIEKSENVLLPLTMMFDYQTLTDINSTVQEMCKELIKYVEVMEEGWSEVREKVKRVHEINNKRDPFDDTDLMLIIWDFKRPIIYRIQRLNELSESINKVLT